VFGHLVYETFLGKSYKCISYKSLRVKCKSVKNELKSAKIYKNEPLLIKNYQLLITF